MKFPFMKCKLLAPFVRLEYDAGQQLVSRFLDAVRTNPDDAWAFVSRVYSAGLNLHELQELLSHGVQHVKLAAYLNSSKNCLTRSVYVKDKMQKMRKLLHLHMIREPDGKWKIFGVDQEECRI